MSIIYAYPTNSNILATDLIIGSATNVVNGRKKNVTKNFEIGDIATFYNETSAIAVAGQNNFFFQDNITQGRKSGSISFVNGNGNETPFGDITILRLSKSATSGYSIINYINTLTDQAIIISQTDNLNNFGIYKFIKVNPVAGEPNFVNILLQPLQYNGNIQKDKFYNLAVYPGFINPDINPPTLEEVLSEGNYSELDANIGQLGLYDISNGDYSKIYSLDRDFNFKDLDENVIFSVQAGLLTLRKTNSVEAFFDVDGLTISRGFNLPDANGTIALTSDIPSLTGYVPYTGATGNVDLGNNDIYVAKLWLYDGPNDNYGSVHFTDGNFHVEDADGHPLFVVEDGFLQIHKDATIQSNLYTTDLTAIRDHYLPDQSGTIALTSDIPSVDAVPTDGSTNPVSSNGVYDGLNSKQDFIGFTPYRYVNAVESIGSNTSGETQLIRVTIPANSFSAGTTSDKFYFRLGFSKVGIVNSATIRVKLTTSASMPAGATSQIAIASIGNTALYAPVERNMAISDGNSLKGFFFTSANVSDNGTSTAAWSSVAFDTTQTQYFYVSITPAASTTDVTYLEYIEISNI